MRRLLFLLLLLLGSPSPLYGAQPAPPLPDPQLVALSGALQQEQAYAQKLLSMLESAQSEIADLKKKCGERCAPKTAPEAARPPTSQGGVPTIGVPKPKE